MNSTVLVYKELRGISRNKLDKYETLEFVRKKLLTRTFQKRLIILASSTSIIPFFMLGTITKYRVAKSLWPILQLNLKIQTARKMWNWFDFMRTYSFLCIQRSSVEATCVARRTSRRNSISSHVRCSKPLLTVVTTSLICVIRTSAPVTSVAQT
jgi:hypothetical protein